MAFFIFFSKKKKNSVYPRRKSEGVVGRCRLSTMHPRLFPKEWTRRCRPCKASPPPPFPRVRRNQYPPVAETRPCGVTPILNPLRAHPHHCSSVCRTRRFLLSAMHLKCNENVTRRILLWLFYDIFVLCATGEKKISDGEDYDRKKKVAYTLKHPTYKQTYHRGKPCQG